MQLALSRSERFTIALRVPAWAGRQTRIAVNGKAIDATPVPGTWANIDRDWKNGDRIELSLDMSLRLVPLDDRHRQIVALVQGPVALFAIVPAPQTFTAQQLLAAQRVGNSSAWEVAVGSEKVRMLPYAAIKDETYRLYQQIG
jgi:hypothetical protein